MAGQIPDQQKIRSIVQGVIFDVLKRKKSKFTLADIKEGVSLTKDLGVDSLDILQMTAVWEKQYKFKVPDEEVKNLDELGSIVKVAAKYWPRD
jgi:acyl carrier protein